ncbi:MAG: hypothetical protein IIZ18_08895, partial [Ruminococcus sp.]|nr:hypothetical protein [Ruminococcus sp.]
VNSAILWDKDLSEFAEDNVRFDYAEFSPDGTQLIFAANNGFAQVQLCSVDIDSGETISSGFTNTFAYHDSESVPIDEQLKRQIIPKIPHFMNCDFTGAEFLE